MRRVSALESDLGDRVLVTGRGPCHRPGPCHRQERGAESREPGVRLWTFSEGKPASMTAARTLEEALEAAGLYE